MPNRDRLPARFAASGGRRSRVPVVAAAGLAVAAIGLVGCSVSGNDGPTPSQGDDSPTATDSPSSPSSASDTVSAVSLVSNVADQSSTVPVSTAIKLTAKDGTFRSVSVVWGKKQHELSGELSSDKSRWLATDRLEPGRRYRVRTVGVDSNGVEATKRSTFRTDDLTLDEQTFPGFTPIGGQTVGVGMPVIVRFDVPVTNRASIERHLSVTSTPQQVGSWHWISDKEVHWRPRHYWKAGTDVTVSANINSVPAGNGIYGQLSRTETFHVGDSVIHRVRLKTDEMRSFVNGKLVKTTPITGGKPGFATRSGTKVIVEKFRRLDMDASTVNISEDSPEYYDLNGVEYAMRVTNSGEFLHAAPWSVGSQGYANVSHGCVGMSTENAGAIFRMSKPGDVVHVTGSNRQMTLDNGYGDWNESYQQWRQGSALH